MSGPRIGGLFEGYGGLTAGVRQVLGGDLAWYSEIDKGALKILNHRFPDVPNVGDITTVDWSQVEPVDILTGGSPCQDLSHAGARKGMTEGTRSNLWVAMREAIAQLRPSLVVWENVRGAYSAEASSELESDPRLLDSVRRRDGEPVLRALGRVLGDLSDLGYDAQWHGLRAADIGAPHPRFRVFLVAHPQGVEQRESLVSMGERAEPTRGALLPSPRTSDTNGAGLHGGDHKGTGPVGSSSYDWLLEHGNVEAQVLSLLPTPAVNDMGEGKTVEAWDEWTAKMKAAHGNGNGHGASLSIEAQRLLPTPTAKSAEDSQTHRSGKRSDELLLNGAALDIYKRSNHALSAQAGSSEELRDVRDATDPQAIRERPTGGPNHLPQEEVLLTELREHPHRPDALGVRVEGSEVHGSDMRDMRDDRTSSCPPQGQGLVEQRPGESGDAVRVLSSETSLAGGQGGAPSSSSLAEPNTSSINWGQYEAAIRRWGNVLGRPAPPPTELGPKGNPRLSAAFSEFLMGLPAGWVTDVPGITRNEALKALGNGVVPQQCAAALRLMLASEVAA